MDEKEPTSWPEYFKAQITKLQEAIKKNRDDDDIPVRNRIRELQDVVALGHRCRGFVNSEFFKDDLMPWLQKEAGQAVVPWRPGQDFDPYSVQANHFFNSGKASVVESLLTWLHRSSDDGLRAEKQIAFEKRKLEVSKERY